MSVTTAPQSLPMALSSRTSSKRPQAVSITEYLAAERLAIARHEYIQGEVRELSGGTYEHNLISGNITTALNNALEDKDYSVLSSDQRVYIEPGIFYYPDVCVVEGDPQIDFDEAVRNPVLVVEVLSSTTEAFDRGEKFRNYRKIVALRHYLIVSQDRSLVEHWTKNSEGLWVLVGEHDGLEESVILAESQTTLPLSRFYRRVALPTEA